VINMCDLAKIFSLQGVVAYFFATPLGKPKLRLQIGEKLLIDQSL